MLRSFYLHTRAYVAAGVVALIFAASYFLPWLYQAALIALVLFILTLLVDMVLLYGNKKGVTALRVIGERFSHGDENEVKINLQNEYPFPVEVSIIEELPDQFQERRKPVIMQLPGKSVAEYNYQLKPLTRGEYIFYQTILMVGSPLRLVSRRLAFGTTQVVKVYPSYMQMRRYQLLAISNRLEEAGVKRVRRLGHSMEFEQIKEYVRGDDYRTVNWKASARRSDLMVNTFTDERSQQIYCVINKGRVMKMPFRGMYLLDHAINAALVLSNVALAKQDKAGLITFAENIDTFLPADRKPTQINLILESLYKQQTRFLEPDLEKLFSVIRNRISHRSLLVYFTNFESFESMERQLPSLKRIARYHLLLVVLFENTELRTLQQSKAETIEDIYIKTIGEKFSNEKRRMVRELQKNGILSILSAPEDLTVNTINKYLEVKNRMSI